MLLRNALVIIILVSISSCNTNKEGNPLPAALSDEWTSIDDLIGNWTELKRDNQGYFHYWPCDGRTPGIEITKDSVFLIPQLENPFSLLIEEHNIEKDSVTIIASSIDLHAEFTFKIIDAKAQQILLKWYFPRSQNRHKQILTRTEFLTDYRLVENPCDVEKTPNLQFLPVEID